MLSRKRPSDASPWTSSKKASSHGATDVRASITIAKYRFADAHNTFQSHPNLLIWTSDGTLTTHNEQITKAFSLQHLNSMLSDISARNMPTTPDEFMKDYKFMGVVYGMSLSVNKDPILASTVHGVVHNIPNIWGNVSNMDTIGFKISTYKKDDRAIKAKVSIDGVINTKNSFIQITPYRFNSDTFNKTFNDLNTNDVVFKLGKVTSVQYSTQVDDTGLIQSALRSYEAWDKLLTINISMTLN